MILEKGDMWSVFGKTTIFMITTNPIMKKDGSIVMGRGIAKQAKEKFPSIPFDFGEQRRKMFLNTYNVGYIGTYEDQDVWYFMVKDHWANKARLDIISNACAEIKTWVSFSEKGERIDLNFPGIGNGGLTREEVLPIIETLPNNVHVWEYAR